MLPVRPDIRWPFALRALRHRNFQYFFVGQGLSVLGTWMQRLAMGWFVYRLTGDKLLLGVMDFAGQLPMLLLAPLSGVLADRWNRRSLLLCTQALSMLQAAVLSVLVLGGSISSGREAWYLVALSLAFGIVNAVDVPVRQAFVVEMVASREDLSSAIPLNSFLMNSTRFIGPPLAGLVVAWWGEGACFVTNAVSYLAVIVALLLMRLPPRPARRERTNMLRDLREGVVYCWRETHIRLSLLFLMVLSVVGIPYAVLMPAFAKDVFHGDARTQGFLLGAVGAGAVVGTLFLATRRSAVGLASIMTVSGGIFGAGLVLFSFSAPAWSRLAARLFGATAPDLPANSVLVLAGPALAAVGFGQVGLLVAGNTLLQTVVDDDKRGRVMSLRAVAFLGMAPVGSLLAGWAARHIGAGPTVFAGGVLCLLGAALFATRLPILRRAIKASYAKQLREVGGTAAGQA